MLVSMITGLGIYLINIPYFTLFRLHLWTVFTCFYVQNGLMGILFSILMMYFISIQIEAQIGTARLIADLLIKNLAVQIIFCLFAMIILYGIFGVAFVMSSGFFPAYFVLLTIRCMKNPN